MTARWPSIRGSDVAPSLQGPATPKARHATSNPRAAASCPCRSCPYRSSPLAPFPVPCLPLALCTADCHQSYFDLIAILAPYMQYNGSSQGVIFEPSTIRAFDRNPALVDNAAMAKALTLYSALIGLSPMDYKVGAGGSWWWRGRVVRAGGAGWGEAGGEGWGWAHGTRVQHAKVDVEEGEGRAFDVAPLSMVKTWPSVG